MIAQGTIVLHGTRRSTGELFISGTDEMGQFISSLRLKSQLFAWDSRSFYGTLIESANTDRTPGLLLSPYTAVLFLPSPRPALHATIQWSDELIQLQQIAKLYLIVLTEGWFVPSFECWKSGRMGWKLRFPKIGEMPSPSVLQEMNYEEVSFLDEWFDQVVLDLSLQETEVTEAMERLLEENVILDTDFTPQSFLAANEWLSEEQWLVSIGWQRDEVPFRTSIQLVEPEEDQEHWRLRLLLQDLENPDLILETDFMGKPLEGDLPAHWQTYVEQRTSQEVMKLKQIVPWLHSVDAPDQPFCELNDDQAWDFMDKESLQLIQAGCSVLLPSWWEELRLRKPRLKAKIKSSVGSSTHSLFGLDQLMQFDWRVVVGDLELSEDEFVRMLAEKKRLMSIRGRWIQLDPDFLTQVMQTVSRVQKNKGLSMRKVLELHWLGSHNDDLLANEQMDTAETVGGSADKLTQMQIEVELNTHLQKFVSQLQSVASIPSVTPPTNLNAELRNYQQEGVSWLLFLRQYGLGGCLADDMGLGKTIQFIAYLLSSRQETKQGPALLVCPTSVMGNWEKELQRFAPSLRVYEHYGSMRAKGDSFIENANESDLVIISYTLAHLDQEDLASVKWDTICLDEAQNIKNVYTKQRTAICQLDASHRIALTGTPIENRLTELWSIFDFLNPGYLGSLSAFTETYVNKIEKSNDPYLIGQVQKLIRPFLLRRVKKDPAIQLDLPEKNEMKTFVSLTVEQGALYENVVQDLFEKLKSATGMAKRGLILSTLTKLKQICDHPTLFLKDERGLISELRSNKLARLLEVVEELRAEGDKCLIFTQYVEMGHLLQKVFEQKMGESVLFLHGGVPKAKRDQLVAKFQESSAHTTESPGIFLLSLKAGGTGLNLTAATHVFHFDRWWNPAVEDQATDRAYRIGQTRDVQVHKFVTLGTLEERIDEMIERKQGLSRQIVGGNESWITEMSNQELRDIFALRKEWIGK